MMKDFKIGDWVHIPAINEKGEVIGGYLNTTWNEKSYHVRMEDGRELDVLESNCKLADYNSKTAFLTEMQALLDKYDASICLSLNEDNKRCLLFDIGKYDYAQYSWLTEMCSDDVFDYDKE